VEENLETVNRNSHLHFTFKAAIYAIIIEALSLPPTILTMGHAGPEGPFAPIGWVGLAINLFGFAVVGRFTPFDSVLIFSICVGVIQVCFIICVAVILKWAIMRMRTG
jgi:hypothetical protein